MTELELNCIQYTHCSVLDFEKIYNSRYCLLESVTFWTNVEIACSDRNVLFTLILSLDCHSMIDGEGLMEHIPNLAKKQWGNLSISTCIADISCYITWFHAILKLQEKLESGLFHNATAEWKAFSRGLPSKCYSILVD